MFSTPYLFLAKFYTESYNCTCLSKISAMAFAHHQGVFLSGTTTYWVWTTSQHQL